MWRLVYANVSFPAVFCQIPCLNGGRCIGRNLCWCPSNSTGKFCHLPAPPPARPSPVGHKDAGHQGPKAALHSMYTLPLSNQQGNTPPLCVDLKRKRKAGAMRVKHTRVSSLPRIPHVDRAKLTALCRMLAVVHVLMFFAKLYFKNQFTLIVNQKTLNPVCPVGGKLSVAAVDLPPRCTNRGSLPQCRSARPW